MSTYCLLSPGLSAFQPEAGSGEDSVTSSDSESAPSPAGSTDGYDADLELTDGPAPHQVRPARATQRRTMLVSTRPSAYIPCQSVVTCWSLA